MYKDKTTPRTDFPNYFNCSLIVGEFRYCEFHSDLPFSRFWVVYIVRRLPPTSGGDFIINGTFLRVSGGPNTLDFFTRDDHLKLVVKGNFSDPSFNCNSITVTFRPDGGLILLVFGELGGGEYRISYAPRMISSIVHNPSKQIITINGDNFFNDDRKVGVFFEKIYQPNINVTINHTQIQVNNFNRVDLGPISIAVVVKDLYIEKNYIHCFPAILTSITSVSNVLGGIVTIKGSKLSSTSNSSLIPSITIGNKQCKYIKSTTTELECKLDPNESGGKKLSVDVNFNGCNSTSSGSSAVIFTYNIPTLSSGSYSNGIVTLIGKNLGNYQESFIQLYANGIITKIDKFNTSSDEKILTIKLSLLRCNSVNINFNMDGISSNNLSISVSLLTNIINKPSVSNVTFYIELYYIDCPISSSTPTITFSNSLTNQCSIPSLQSSTSDFYQTTFSIPYGTGINKQYTFKYIK